MLVSPGMPGCARAARRGYLRQRVVGRRVGRHGHAHVVEVLREHGRVVVDVQHAHRHARRRGQRAVRALHLQRVRRARLAVQRAPRRYDLTCRTKSNNKTNIKTFDGTT